MPVPSQVLHGWRPLASQSGHLGAAVFLEHVGAGNFADAVAGGAVDFAGLAAGGAGFERVAAVLQHGEFADVVLGDFEGPALLGEAAPLLAILYEPAGVGELEAAVGAGDLALVAPGALQSIRSSPLQVGQALSSFAGSWSVPLQVGADERALAFAVVAELIVFLGLPLGEDLLAGQAVAHPGDVGPLDEGGLVLGLAGGRGARSVILAGSC